MYLNCQNETNTLNCDSLRNDYTCFKYIYIQVTEYCFIWNGSVFRWIKDGKNVRNQARQKDGKNIILIKGMFFFTL